MTYCKKKKGIFAGDISTQIGVQIRPVPILDRGLDKNRPLGEVDAALIKHYFLVMRYYVGDGKERHWSSFLVLYQMIHKWHYLLHKSHNI